MHFPPVVGFIISIVTTLALLFHLYRAQTTQQPLMRYWRWSLLQAVGQFLFFGQWLLQGVLPESVCSAIALAGCVLTIAGGIGVLMTFRNGQIEPPQKERIPNR